MSALTQEHRAFLAAVQSAPAGGLAIYRGSIANNRRAAMQAAYPVVERLVGEAFFAEAVRVYASAFPSTSGDLHRFGVRFAPFLAGYAPAKALAYLADVAALEWARHRASLAPDVPALDFAALAGIAPQGWGELRFALHPSVALLDAAHAALGIWEANQPGRDGTIAEVDVPERVLVWRDGANVVRAVRVGADAWRLLQAFADGRPLEQALEGWEGSAPVARCMAGLGGDGVIAGFWPG